MSPKTVLVVDDEHDVLNVLDKGLQAEGYQTFIADNGHEAILLAKSKRPDVIVLDVVLPDIDGGSVAAKLREDNNTRSIPIIFLTALISKDEEFHYGQMIGNNITLSKPYDLEQLVSLIEKCVLITS